MSEFILLLTLVFLTQIKAQINVTNYKRMPPLYVFDDYSKCFSNSNVSIEPLYCLVYAEIIPDNSSQIWHQIQTFSNSYKFHYRHDRLFRGLCLKDYNMSYADINGYEYANLNISRSQIQTIFERIYSSKPNLNYQHEINQFLNGQFISDYNLSLETMTLYCDNLKQPKAKDFGFKFTAFIFITIILLNFLSSIYDCYLKYRSTSCLNHTLYYKIKHKKPVTNYLTLFSIPRNMQRLLSNNPNNIGGDLRCLDGFRSILSFLIVYEHLFYFQYAHLENPEFFENLYHHFYMQFLLHGMVMVELFFVLSGLLLYLKMNRSKFVTPATNVKSCLRTYAKLLVARYLRYLPSLGLLILFNANIILFLQNGPYWKFMMKSNSYLCQKYWWKTVLMFNNFDISDSCLSHTWYIAADFQLYAFYLFLLIFLSKFPNLKSLTWLIVAFLSAAIPVIINYMHKLESIAYMSLESFRYFYLIDIETGIQLYIPSYTNLHGFLMGTVCGELYLKFFIKKDNKTKQSFERIVKFATFIGWPCIMIIFYVGTIMLWQEHSFLTALYVLLHRHVCVIILSITTVLHMMSSRHQGIILKILSSSPFRLLARISFQVYLWHFIVVLMAVNYFQQPINVTFYLLAIVFIVVYLLANVVALIIAVTFEFPISEFLNLLNIK